MKPPLIYQSEAMIYLHARGLYHVLLLICNNQLTEWKTDKSQDIKALGVWERNTPLAQTWGLCSAYFALAGSKATQAWLIQMLSHLVMPDTAISQQQYHLYYLFIFHSHYQRKEKKAHWQQDIHLYRWPSCRMSGEESPIYQAMPSRNICMRSMKLRKEVTGQSLHDAASKNLRKAVLMESVSRQGSLS